MTHTLYAGEHYPGEVVEITIEDADVPTAAEPKRSPVAGRAGAAAGVAWRALVAALDVFDWITVLGTLMLLAGLWVWAGAGPAWTAVGALVVWMGIVGGRKAAEAATAEQDADVPTAAEA